MILYARCFAAAAIAAITYATLDADYNHALPAILLRDAFVPDCLRYAFRHCAARDCFDNIDTPRVMSLRFATRYRVYHTLTLRYYARQRYGYAVTPARHYVAITTY